MERRAWLQKHRILTKIAALIGTIVGITVALHTGLPFLVGILAGLLVSMGTTAIISNLGWWLAPDGRRANS